MDLQPAEPPLTVSALIERHIAGIYRNETGLPYASWTFVNSSARPASGESVSARGQGRSRTAYLRKRGQLLPV